MARALVHPGLMASLADFLPLALTVQTRASGRDAFGQPSGAWASLAGHVSLPAALSPAQGREVKGAAQSYAIASHLAVISGAHSDITTGMRALIGSTSYDIVSVDVDDTGTLTQLALQVVS
jgi:head-tail adaptor